MREMYCKTCGKEINGAEKFCPGCGNPIKTVKGLSNNVNSKMTGKTNKWWRIFQVAVIIVIIGILWQAYNSKSPQRILGTWYLLQNDKINYNEYLTFMKDGKLESDLGKGTYRVTENEIIITIDNDSRTAEFYESEVFREQMIYEDALVLDEMFVFVKED